MNRVWLREYEILLSSNRREKPNTTIKINKIENNKNNKQDNKKKKKKKINENELANDLLVLSMKGEYHRTAPELIEKKYGTMKLLYPSNSFKSSFRPLNTFEEFEKYENKKELFQKTGNEMIFHELYPTISPHIQQLHNQQNNENDYTSTIHNNNNNTNNNNKNRIRPKSSPSPGYRTKNTNSLVDALLKSSNDDLQIQQSDLEVAPAPIDIEIAEKAENVWEGLINEIWHNGQCILYGDLTTFATTWQKTSSTRQIVKYLCVLFGLKTNPMNDFILAAERSLFRELVPLLKYLREVNPLTVPRRRLLKAQSIYKKHFQQLNEEHDIQITESESRLHVTQIEQKFLRWIHSFQQVLNVIIHASVHQTILENDAIDDAEETIERLRRKQLIAELKQTEASKAANKLTHVKKKKLNNKKLSQNSNQQQQQQQQNNNHQHNNNQTSSKQIQPPHSMSQYSNETGLESNSLPTIAMMSLTGVIPVDDILSREEKSIKKVILDGVQEETCEGLPPVIPGYGQIKSGKEYFDDEGEEVEVKNDLLGASLSSISQGLDSTSIHQ